MKLIYASCLVSVIAMSVSLMRLPNDQAVQSVILATSSGVFGGAVTLILVNEELKS